MKKWTLADGTAVSAVACGCMRLSYVSAAEGAQLLRTAAECGVNLFDHADIYGKNHACEEAFAIAFAKSGLKREDILLQTKCGITPHGYDFSPAHITACVNESLRALHTDYLDLLLLHRPDTLMEPEETAEALLALKKAGKVRGFGVSNHSAMQMELLQQAMGSEPILVNQMQISLAHTPLFNQEMSVNMALEQSVDRSGDCLSYCRLHKIRLQAWSPLQKGFFGGCFLGDSDYAPLNRALQELAETYKVTPAAVAIAWLCRHPAGIVPVLGTTDFNHFKEAAAGGSMTLTRAEWYELYRAAGNEIP